VTLCLLLHNLVFVQHLAEVWLYFLICKLLFVCYEILFAPKTRMTMRELYVFHLLDAETNQRICFLNVSPDEVIRSLFYNKNNDSLITVSVYASDNFSSLKCRSTRIEYVNLINSTPPPPTSKIEKKIIIPKRERKTIPNPTVDCRNFLLFVSTSC
jgi:hypothetical protein